MTSRRRFLSGLVASGCLPAMGWADAGAPGHLAAARDRSGRFALYGLDMRGGAVFRIPLAGRGHAAAAHPTAAEAVAFARRPGRYALIVDCARGAVRQELAAPPGHHFYGHGAFVQDGDLLLTTENEIDTGRGRIGLWSRSRGYARIGSWSSGGIGPHEIIRLPGTDSVAVANGGIRTHPAHGRSKLNLPDMRPNLTILDGKGRIADVAALAPDLHLNSLRHIAAGSDGSVACAFQWQGAPADTPPLLGRYNASEGLRLADAPDDLWIAMRGYAGSVASDGQMIALTAPRGGLIARFGPNLALRGRFARADICGVAGSGGSMMATDGLGGVHVMDGDGLKPLARHPVAWDNHLVAINGR